MAQVLTPDWMEISSFSGLKLFLVDSLLYRFDLRCAFMESGQQHSLVR